MSPPRPVSLPDLIDAVTSCTTTAPAADLPAVLACLAAGQSMIASRLVAEEQGARPTATLPAPDKLVKIAEAAEMLSMTVDYLYHRAKDLPFTVHLGPKQLRFSTTGIQKWLTDARGGIVRFSEGPSPRKNTGEPIKAGNVRGNMPQQTPSNTTRAGREM